MAGPRARGKRKKTLASSSGSDDNRPPPKRARLTKKEIQSKLDDLFGRSSEFSDDDEASKKVKKDGLILKTNVKTGGKYLKEGLTKGKPGAAGRRQRVDPAKNNKNGKTPTGDAAPMKKKERVGVYGDLTKLPRVPRKNMGQGTPQRPSSDQRGIPERPLSARRSQERSGEALVGNESKQRSTAGTSLVSNQDSTADSAKSAANPGDSRRRRPSRWSNANEQPVHSSANGTVSMEAKTTASAAAPPASPAGESNLSFKERAEQLMREKQAMLHRSSRIISSQVEHQRRREEAERQRAWREEQKRREAEERRAEERKRAEEARAAAAAAQREAQRAMMAPTYTHVQPPRPQQISAQELQRRKQEEREVMERDAMIAREEKAQSEAELEASAKLQLITQCNSLYAEVEKARLALNPSSETMPVEELGGRGDDFAFDAMMNGGTGESGSMLGLLGGGGAGLSLDDRVATLSQCVLGNSLPGLATSPAGTTAAVIPNFADMSLHELKSEEKRLKKEKMELRIERQARTIT